MTTNQRSGTENYSVEIIQALAALPKRPDLTLYTRAGQESPPTQGTHVRESGPRRLWTHIGLSRAMMRDRPHALFVPSHVVPLAHPRASVVTVHDLGYLYEPDAHPRRQRLMLDRTTRWNARVAAHIIAVSGQTRDDLIRHYEVDPARITVIHHGVNHHRFYPRTDQEVKPVLARYGISEPYVLFVSTVQPRKNVDRILEAFKTSGFEHVTLVIAGRSGWMSASIEAMIEASSKKLRVLRLGHIADDDLPALYSGASAFVLPSLFEGFGMGVIEAMACGTPVVTSNHGSLAEVAGDAALLVDPLSVTSIAEGVRAALEPDESARLSALGLEHAASFSWANAAKQTLETIESAFAHA